MEQTSLTVRSDRKKLAEIRAFIERISEQFGLSLEVMSELRLAVDEACANVMMHGYGDGDGEISVDARTHDDRLVVTIRDQAPLFNPLTQGATPSLDTPLDLRPPGGMGIMMIKQFTDRVDYQVTESGGNALILTKLRAAAGGPSG